MRTCPDLLGNARYLALNGAAAVGVLLTVPAVLLGVRWGW
jgi:hypothetical protein